MRTCIVTRRNWVAEPITVFSGGAWVTPYSVLVDGRPQVVLQARSPEAFDTMFDVDLGAQRNNIGLISFENLRLTQLAIMRIRISNEPLGVETDASSVTVTAPGSYTYDSGVVSGWPQDKAPFSISPWGLLTINGQYEPEEYVAIGMPRYFVPPSVVTGRYVRVNIRDNTATIPPQIGCFGVWEIWEPLRGPDLGWETVFVDEANIVSAAYGSRYITQRGKRRRLNIGFSNIRQIVPATFQSPSVDVELMQEVIGWCAMMGKSRPIVISMLPDDRINLEKRTVYGTLVNDLTVENPFAFWYRLSLSLEQLI